MAILECVIKIMPTLLTTDFDFGIAKIFTLGKDGFYLHKETMTIDIDCYLSTFIV